MQQPGEGVGAAVAQRLGVGGRLVGLLHVVPQERGGVDGQPRSLDWAEGGGEGVDEGPAYDVRRVARVQVEPRLDDALEAAITLAEEEGEYAGGGVLVTGSVITVGEARLLLGRG